MDSVERLIASLERDKAILLEKIAELRNEVKSIDALITRSKAEKYAVQTNEIVTRRNMERIYNEQAIIDVINSSKNGLTTSGVKIALDRVGHNINYNTLRSYISRMRDKGTIFRPRGKYKWLVSTQEASDIFT